MSNYRKTVTALVGAVIGFATLVVTSDPSRIVAAEWLSGVIGLATAVGVYGVRNTEETDWPERGAITLREALVIAALCLAIFALLVWLGAFDSPFEQ